MRKYQPYFFRIERGRYFEGNNNTDSIPSVKFENLMKKYLPFSKEQIRMQADKSQDGERYLWEPLRCGNMIPQSMPMPEVVQKEDKKDGRIILTVDAVLKQKGTDHLFRHKVTLKKYPDGRIRYMGNRIQTVHKGKVPDYQKRNRE